jgi:hypothetical protein
MSEPGPATPMPADVVRPHVRVAVASGRIPAWLLWPAVIGCVVLIIATAAVAIRTRTLKVHYMPGADDLATVTVRPLPTDPVLTTFAEGYCAQAETYSSQTLSRLADRVADYVDPTHRDDMKIRLLDEQGRAKVYGQVQTCIIQGSQVAVKSDVEADVDVAVLRMLGAQDRTGAVTIGTTDGATETIVLTYRLRQDVPTDQNPFGLLVTGRTERTIAAWEAARRPQPKPGDKKGEIPTVEHFWDTK